MVLFYVNEPVDKTLHNSQINDDDRFVRFFCRLNTLKTNYAYARVRIKYGRSQTGSVWRLFHANMFHDHSKHENWKYEWIQKTKKLCFLVKIYFVSMTAWRNEIGLPVKFVATFFVFFFHSFISIRIENSAKKTQNKNRFDAYAMRSECTMRCYFSTRHFFPFNNFFFMFFDYVRIAWSALNAWKWLLLLRLK